MKRIAIALPLFLALLLTPAVPAQADEAQEARIQKLESMILDLQAQVQKLKAEVKQLRAAVAQGMHETSEEVETPHTVETPAAVVGGSIVGTWKLDREHATKAIEEMIQAQLSMIQDPEQRAMAEAMIKSQMQMIAQSLDFTLEAGADGSWEVTGSVPMQGEMTAGGTWTRDGDAYILKTTHENGEPQDDGESQRITIENGAIMLRPDEAPFSLRFVRQ